MSFLDMSSGAFDDAVNMTCVQSITPTQRTALLNEIGSSLLEIADFRGQQLRANVSLLDTAEQNLVLARDTIARAQRRADGRYCLGRNVDRLLDSAAFDVTAFEASVTETSPPGVPEPQGGGGGGGGGSSGDFTPGTGDKEPNDGSDVLPLRAPTSNVMMVAGAALLGGAAILGIAYLVRRR